MTLADDLEAEVRPLWAEGQTPTRHSPAGPVQRHDGAF